MRKFTLIRWLRINTPRERDDTLSHLAQAPLAIFCWTAAAAVRASSPAETAAAVEGQSSTGTPLISNVAERSDAEVLLGAESVVPRFKAGGMRTGAFLSRFTADVRDVLSHSVFVLAALGCVHLPRVECTRTFSYHPPPAEA